MRPMFTIARLIGIVPRYIRFDRTVHGWHVVIRWSRSLAPAEKVALQSVLGSDARREALNLMRVLNGHGYDARWNILYAYKLR